MVNIPRNLEIKVDRWSHPGLLAESDEEL